MDPIPGILDEEFFLTASDQCLMYLAALVDDMVALHLQNYLASPAADSAVSEKINHFLGEKIKLSTFHKVLQERKSCDVVAKIQLPALPTMTGNTAPIISELQFLKDNYQYIRAFIEPRRKEDYEAFCACVPEQYTKVIAANKAFFYQAGAKRRSTGVQIIITRHDDWLIALYGLKALRYFVQKGFRTNNYITTRF